MQFIVTQAGFPLPVGQHPVTFKGVEPYIPDPGSRGAEYGPAVMVKFTVTQGEFAGKDVSKICSTKFSEKSSLGKIAMQISGQPLEIGSHFDFTAYTGLPGSVIVVMNDNGNPTISTFIPSGDLPKMPLQQRAGPQTQPPVVHQPQAVAQALGQPQVATQPQVIPAAQPQVVEPAPPQPIVNPPNPPNPPFPAE